MLALAQEHGATVEHGVALDDHLSASTRIAIDAEARERHLRWRERRAAELTIEGVDLTCIWELEMLAQCFQPAARLLHGLPLALEAIRPRRLETRGLDQGTQQLAQAIVAPMNIRISSAPAQAVIHERVRLSPSRLASAASAIGVPPRVRGDVMCIPYWSLYPAIASMAGSSRHLRPVAARVTLPGLGPRGAVAVAARGGWLGLPGRRARAVSRAAVTVVVAAVEASSGDDPIEAAIDAHALQTLTRIAGETLAHVRQVRRGLRASRIRLGLISYDSEEHARMLLSVLRGDGVPTLLVQHGFPARQGDPDMRLADHLAIWCEHERSLAPARDPATVTVTGNPGAAHLAGGPSLARAGRGRSLILVDYPGRLTSRIDSRIASRHVAVALKALAATRPGTRAVIRPHPTDLESGGYARLASAHPELQVEVDARTPIELLLAGSDLCVGALSTAALQACVLGVPTVLLDVAAIERPWPFDGSAIPTSADPAGLADAIGTALCSREVAGREAALEALGARRDAVERVADLAAGLAR